MIQAMVNFDLDGVLMFSMQIVGDNCELWLHVTCLVPIYQTMINNLRKRLLYSLVRHIKTVVVLILSDTRCQFHRLHVSHALQLLVSVN